jgi:hypothetical protein
VTPGTVTVPWPSEGTVTDARADALGFLATIARLCNLPLPEVITVTLTQPDAEAQAVIDAAAEQCRRRGVTCSVIDSDWLTGMEIPGVVRYRLTHLRDAYLHGHERSTDTKGAAT